MHNREYICNVDSKQIKVMMCMRCYIYNNAIMGFLYCSKVKILNLVSIYIYTNPSSMVAPSKLCWLLYISVYESMLRKSHLAANFEVKMHYFNFIITCRTCALNWMHVREWGLGGRHAIKY